MMYFYFQAELLVEPLSGMIMVTDTGSRGQERGTGSYGCVKRLYGSAEQTSLEKSFNTLLCCYGYKRVFISTAEFR